ncbi:hypothetical protein SprV_0602202000 [Sparganum proliferum]
MIRKNKAFRELAILTPSRTLPRPLRRHDRVFIMRGKLLQLDRSSLNMVHNHIRRKLVDLGRLEGALTKSEKANLRAELEKTPWMNMECLDAKRAKQACFEEWEVNPCQETADAWTAARDRLKEELLKLRQFWIEQMDSVDYFQDVEDIPLANASCEPSQELVPPRSEGRYPVYSYTAHGGPPSPPSGIYSPPGAARRSQERSRSPLPSLGNKGPQHQCSSYGRCGSSDSCSNHRNYSQNQSHDDLSNQGGCRSPLDSAEEYCCRQCSHHHYCFHPPELTKSTFRDLFGSDCCQCRGELEYPRGPLLHRKAEHTLYYPVGEAGERLGPGQSHHCATEGASGREQRRYELAGAEDHVSGSVVKTESTPAFWEKSLVEMAIEKVQEDASEDLLDDVVEGDVSVVTTELFVPFPFLEMVDCHILEILRDFISELRLLE